MAGRGFRGQRRTSASYLRQVYLKYVSYLRHVLVRQHVFEFSRNESKRAIFFNLYMGVKKSHAMSPKEGD